MRSFLLAAAPDSRPTAARSIRKGMGDQPGRARWRKRLFIATSRQTAALPNTFALPREQTVIMGSRIQL